MLLQILHIRQLEIASAFLGQLSMRALLNHSTALKHVDTIGFLNRAQAVGDGDGSTALRGAVQGRLDDLLGLRVQGRGRFVEQQDARVAKERACDADALALAAGEERASGAEEGVEAVTSMC